MLFALLRAQTISTVIAQGLTTAFLVNIGPKVAI